MTKAVEPPPRPRRDVTDRAGTLQGQLRALATQTMRRSRSSARASTSSSGARAEDGDVDAANVTKLQRRALEVLLRMDKDVKVNEPSSAEERAEANSLRLGAALLRMRGKGDGDGADLLEGLHDAFMGRRSAYLPRTPFADGAGGPHPARASDGKGRHASRTHGFVYDDADGATRRDDAASVSVAEHAATMSLLLELAGTGGRRPSDAAARSAFRHLAAGISAETSGKDSNDVQGPEVRSALDEPDADTAAAQRAARAADWLRLAPASELEATPSLSFGASPAIGRPAAKIDSSDAVVAAGSHGRSDSAYDLAEMARALEATPSAGALSFGASSRDSQSEDGFADPFAFARRPGGSRRRGDGSMSSSLSSFKPLALPPWGEGGMLDGPSDEPTTTGGFSFHAGMDDEQRSPGEETRGDEKHGDPAGDEYDAACVTRSSAWLAAAEDGERGDAVFGWDVAPEAKPACGAFMSRPPDAFGRAYDRHLRPARTLFGGAKPAVAAEEEVVHAARRALAGGSASATGLRNHRLPLRLPAAGAGVVAATLAPLANAAEHRAELERFLARSSGFGSSGFGADDTGTGTRGLALQAASQAVRGVLRAQAAALHTLPAAAAARRSAERQAADPLSAPYRRHESVDSADANSEVESSGVTLLEALAHTRRLRAQLASLRGLCLHPTEPSSGVEFIGRLVGALQAGGGANPGARPLLRYLAAASTRPALAQLECWLHRADVDDPHGEFVVVTARGWGSAASVLEYSPAEAGIMEWSEAESSGATRVLIDPETEESDGPVDLTRLPPWEGGHPGRAGGGGHVTAEAAWLRVDDMTLDDERMTRESHPLLGGLERKVLATGVQLRVLQRLPQTAAFAARMSASVDASDGSDGTPPWTLAFTAAELTEAASRRGKRTRSLRAAAEESLRAMAATRAAAGARTEAARRARRAAAIARKLERESVVAEAREELLTGFADRMAELVARHERLRWQRKRRALGGRRREELESRAKRDEEMVRTELAKELAARERGEEHVPADPTNLDLSFGPGGTEPFERYDSPAAADASPPSAPSTPGTGATNYFDDVRVDESFVTAASDASPVRNLAEDLTGVNLNDSAEFEPTNAPSSSIVQVEPPKTTEDSIVKDLIDANDDGLDDGLEVPLPVVLRECVEAVVRDRHDVVSRLVVATMLDHLGVEAHLSAVGRYVLCGAGDFATALVQGLEATASSSAALAARARASRMGVAGYGGGVSARELRAVNEVAARETSVFGDPLAQRFELTPGHPRDPHAVFSEHSHTMVDFVHGTYRLEWPNSLLLPERSIGKLADAQRSILRVRHARLALQEAHDRVHEAGHVDVSSLGHRGGGERGRAGRALALRRLRRLSLLAAEFGHFMNAIESHVGGAVHGAAGVSLNASLRTPRTNEPKPTDLYELRGAIVSYATDVYDACLLSNRDVPLRFSVDQALQLALDFRAAMRRCPPETLLSDGGVYAAVQAIHARFKATTRALCGRLREAAADPGGALGGVSPGRAAALLETLDYNGFYLGENL